MNGTAVLTEELARIVELDEVWKQSGHGQRLRAARRAAERAREQIAYGPRVVSVRTLPLTTLAYPTKFAFWGAPYSPAPYVILTHRALLVQFLQHGELKSLLFNPTDDVAARATPFFARLIAQVGDYVAFNLLAKRFESLESQLGALGVTAEQIDYVAFDHFHIQDLRPLLGTTDGRHQAPSPMPGCSRRARRNDGMICTRCSAPGTSPTASAMSPPSGWC
jgi:hypothetical protein